MQILNTTFLRNKAQNGGAIHQAAITEPTYLSRADSTMQIYKSAFKANSAEIEGGGIYNDGSLTFGLGDFSGNEAGSVGGGIVNHDKMVIQETTFIRNKAKQSGGGMSSTGTTLLVRSTFVENYAIRGGGLAVLDGFTTVQNDTFSDNAADDMGGGISVNSSGSAKADLQASFITVAYNKAIRGGGIAVNGGSMKIKNSIVAYSPSGGDCSTSGGTFNAVSENMNSDGSCSAFTINGDPLLDLLANYGGPTDTHALKMDSPAINAAPDCTTLFGAAVAIDQRSFARPFGLYCDLGSFELQQLLPAPSISTTTPTITLTITSTKENATLTPEPPSITAIKNANCRYGPGMLYAIADTLMKGKTAVVVGRNDENTWWQITGPRYGTLCWVAFTTVEENGPMEGVPIGVAPPEPTLTSERQIGCYVFNDQGLKMCVVPCPANPRPGGACSP